MYLHYLGSEEVQSGKSPRTALAQGGGKMGPTPPGNGNQTVRGGWSLVEQTTAENTARGRAHDRVVKTGLQTLITGMTGKFDGFWTQSSGRTHMVKLLQL